MLTARYTGNAMAPFDAAALQRQVETSLARDLPPGKRVAVVAVVGLTGDAEFRVCTRSAAGWSLGAVVRREKGAAQKWGWSGGVVVTSSF